MKKTIAVILSAALIALTLCSCSGSGVEMTEENITKSVNTAMTALTEFDTKALEKYVDSSTLNTIIGYANKHKQFKELGVAIFENLEYEITDINTEAKTVTLNVYNKELSGVAYEFASNLMRSYSTLELLKRLDDEEWLDKNLKELTDMIDKAYFNGEPIEITLSIKEGKKNLVFSFDENAEDAVSGGALTSIMQAIR